jgi:YD repeat-containing protein
LPDCESEISAFNVGSDSIERVDLDSSGNPLSTSTLSADGDMSISDDGSLVAFAHANGSVSPAESGDTNGPDLDVFVRDLDANTTTRVNPAAANRSSFDPSISGDGQYVVFASDQDYGSIESTGPDTDIFVRDLSGSSTPKRISVSSSGGEALRNSGVATSREPFISGDGRFVAFVSNATNIENAKNINNYMPRTANSSSAFAYAVYVHDRDADDDDVYDETGGGDTRTIMVPTGRYPTDVQLSDDGLTLAVSTSRREGGSRHTEIWRRPAANGAFGPIQAWEYSKTSLADDGDRLVGVRGSDAENSGADSGSVSVSRYPANYWLFFESGQRANPYVGDPVSVASGSLVAQSTDLTSPPGVFGLDFTRHYSSLGTADSVMGPGWTNSFDVAAVEQPDGAVDLIDPGGRIVHFVPDGGSWERPATFFGDLAERGDGSFAVEFFDGTVWEFDTDGLLEEKTNWDGQTVTIARDTTYQRLTEVESSTGATLQFTYDSGGYLIEVEASDGRTATYGYSSTDYFLETVTGSGGLVITTYETDGLGRITHEEDGEGSLVADTVYGDDGRVAAQTAPSGGITTFTYDDTVRSTTVHDSLTDTTLIYEFNERGQVAQITDAFGRIVSSDYDADGNLLEATSRIGGGVEQTFDPDTGMLLTSTTPGVGTTTYTYDSANRVATVTTPNGTVGGAMTTYTYDGTERMPATVTDELSHTWTYDVVDGLVMSMEDPDGVVTDYTYLTSRLLESETRYDGATPMTTLYGYDTQGRLVETTSPEGNVTTRSYTAAELLDYEISADDGRTDYTYDDAGRVLTITGPEVSPTDTRRPVTRYRYNAAGLLWRECVPNPDHTASLIAAGEGCSPDQTGGDWPEAVTEYTYDDNGQVTAVEHPDGSTTAYEWGPMGRLLSTTDEEARTTEYEYDDDGNQTVTRDNDGNETATTYDSLGRVDVVADPEERTTDTDYDTSGRVAEVTDRGATTTYGYDDLNRVSATTDARGGETVTTYTDGGRVDTVTDPAGVVTTNGYDTAGRLITKTLSGGRTTTYAYDLDGRMTSVTSPEGDVTATTYDEMGRPLTVADPAGVTTTYSWSHRGLKLSEQLEGQGTALFVYDLADNLVTVTDPLGAETDYAYDSRGRRVSRTDDDGNVETWSYYDDGKIESYTDPSSSSAKTRAPPLTPTTLRGAWRRSPTPRIARPPTATPPPGWSRNGTTRCRAWWARSPRPTTSATTR